MVGLFFGSFNPIHVGHVALAEVLLENAGLDEIWFVVSPHNPLKSNDGLLPDGLRLKLSSLAISDNPKFKVCDVEFDMPKPNYTLQTLEKLSSDYPEKNFALIIGADNLACFPEWKDYQTILSDYQIIVYPRKGYKLEELAKLYPQVKIVDAPLFQISSTEIRELLKEKKDASRWLHPLVNEYFLKNKLI
jgi:nicotinate-nucleotide adenylyltransferase